MEFLFGVLSVVLIIVSVLLIILVLMQKTKGAEIGAVFGSGAAKAVLGASAATILTKITYWLGAIFLTLVLILSYLSIHIAKSKSVIESIPAEQTQKK
ncbi:MAG TPA: preprotein translocase subunit SecG [Sulfurihydrogenibium sp.]|uniref:preprotein translocase subunit SecG n=1 Tax=Sulfurihydrogenibium sp. (strain YO3AOP1) TaxID=436114 RepID=UPI0001725125|nr:preprotein translocase subunit SecG [Sulfurihydrogenibium sp. YO3AOP1]ACD66766.1 preprotein translocase, SecG subunit [Sulfurihydrogenibium sp. YO3AOP1]HBT98949.1 preprotein translocase subunit SecG [Sulfurihydrogenibium sp.]